MEIIPSIRKTFTFAVTACGLLGGMLATNSCDNPAKDAAAWVGKEGDAIQLSQGERLILACYNRDESEVRRILEAGQSPDVCIPGRLGEVMTPLQAAINGYSTLTGPGCEPIVRLLLEHGADPTYQPGEDGYTVLQEARGAADGELIDLLLEYKAPIRFVFAAAAQYGETELLKKYLAHGADVESRNADGDTALHIALQYQDSPECIELLCQAGADANAVDSKGRTPLMLCYGYIPAPGNKDSKARDQKRKAIAAILVKYGADAGLGSCFGYSTAEVAYLQCGECINGYTPSPALKAFRALYRMCGDLDCNLAEAERLMADLNDINALHYEGGTLLTHASYKLNLRMVDLLLKHGANPDAMDSRGGTPIKRLHSGRSKEDYARSAAIRKRLIEAGATAIARQGEETVWLASVAHDLPELRRFLSNPEERRRVPLKDVHAFLWRHAQEDDFPGCVDFLFSECGRDINEKDADGKTLLMLAAEGKCDMLVRSLLQRGADANATDNDGCTALMLAVESAGAVQALLDAGANPDAQDKRGDTAAHHAVRKADYIFRHPLSDSIAPLRAHKADFSIRNAAGQTPEVLYRSLLGALYINAVIGGDIKDPETAARAENTARSNLELLKPGENAGAAGRTGQES